MAARIWNNDSDITLTYWSIENFNFLLNAVICVLICFCHSLGLTFSLLLNFLFTRGYYISNQFEILHIIAIFSTLYTELKTWDENFVSSQAIHILHYNLTLQFTFYITLQLTLQNNFFKIIILCGNEISSLSSCLQFNRKGD